MRSKRKCQADGRAVQIISTQLQANPIHKLTYTPRTKSSKMALHFEATALNGTTLMTDMSIVNIQASSFLP
jgi:hypothetical protein